MVVVFFCHHIVFYKSVYYSYVKNNFGSWLPASTGVWTRARRIKQRLVECQCKVSKAWSLIELLSVLEARIGYEQTLENIIHLPDSLHSSINDSFRCLYTDQEVTLPNAASRDLEEAFDFSVNSNIIDASDISKSDVLIDINDRQVVVEDPECQ